MNHEDVVEFYLYNNIKINDLVSIEHVNGKNINASIAETNVIFEYDNLGNKINSRIKITAPKPLVGVYTNSNPIELFTEDIINIKKTDFY
jgi:hypothetical protein